MENTIRAFIAVELPETVRSQLEALQRQFRTLDLPIRFVSPENVHLTLSFLGEIPERVVPRISGSLAAAEGSGPISLTARGLGVFPGLRRPKVIWVGVGGETDALADLKRRLDEDLVSAGISLDRRGFRAHLTLGRVKGRIDSHRLGSSIGALSGFGPVPFRADRVILFRSLLKPTGAEYRVLFSVFLSPPAAARDRG